MDVHVYRWAVELLGSQNSHPRKTERLTDLFLARPPVLFGKVTVVHFILLHYWGSVQAIFKWFSI
jgi:hypothetical protein